MLYRELHRKFRSSLNISGDDLKEAKRCKLYRKLHRKFRSSLNISGDDLKEAVAHECTDYTRGPAYGILCRAAKRCFEGHGAKSGAKNLDKSIFQDGNIRPVVAVALGTFFTDQLGLEDLDYTSRDQYKLAADFFRHQAEFPTSSDGVYKSVLRELLKSWWERNSETFNVDSADGLDGWLLGKLEGSVLTACLSPEARADFPEIQLPFEPVKIGDILKTYIIWKLIGMGAKERCKNQNAAPNIRTKVGECFRDKNVCSDDELAMVVLMNGAPTAQWEVACAAAGLVEFKWRLMPKEKGTEHV